MRLKYQVQTIVIHPFLRNNAIYKYKGLENIKNIYKQSGKCDDHQQFKDILDTDMVYTPEGFTNNSTIPTMTSSPVKKASAKNHCVCLLTF